MRGSFVNVLGQKWEKDRELGLGILKGSDQTYLSFQPNSPFYSPSPRKTHTSMTWPPRTFAAKASILAIHQFHHVNGPDASIVLHCFGSRVSVLWLFISLLLRRVLYYHCSASWILVSSLSLLRFSCSSSRIFLSWMHAFFIVDVCRLGFKPPHHPFGVIPRRR